MPIQQFPPTVAGQNAAFAVADPKNVRFNDNGFEVRTGSDYAPLIIKTPDEIDADAAKASPKLRALAQLTPAQAHAWVNSNITTLADAKDVIATLAAAVAVLARRL